MGPRHFRSFWHDRFRRFGKRAGFKNSIYEKYIFFPPGMRSKGLPGEVVMMNAMPYPGPEGELRRTIVFLADGKYVDRKDNDEYTRHPVR